VGITLIPCRSWLASEGGLSSNINVERDGLFAGKPAPTGFAVFISEAQLDEVFTVRPRAHLTDS
jgi:hypothetical protein